MSERRYLFFSYTCISDTHHGTGNLWGDFDSFPSNDMLKSKAKLSSVEGCTIVITGWNEFKSKEDFNAFTGQS